MASHDRHTHKFGDSMEKDLEETGQEDMNAAGSGKL
jgi:hypothetical protein